jgi:hypothetical protein
MAEDIVASSPTSRALSLHQTVVIATVVLLALLGIITEKSLRLSYEDEAKAALLHTKRSAQKHAVRVSEVLDRVNQNTGSSKRFRRRANP